MAINQSDIQLLRAERNTDENDGGGRMTGDALVSGDINNLWDDISRGDLALGDVSLRKLYCAVRSANVDKFLGAHVMVAKDSAADNVSTLLFSTGSHYDERLSAQDAIEQFVVLGTRSPLRPVGTQRLGQTSLLLYSSEESDAPELGEVLFLIDSQSGDKQPVKATKVSSQKQRYTYVAKNGDYAEYEAIEHTVQITQPLLFEFAANDPSPVAQHSTEVFRTQSNNSAKYYGVKPLAAPAAAGDRSVKVDSIFAPIVPSATTEQPLLDQKPGRIGRTVVGANGVVQLDLGSHSGSVSLALPSAWRPGTLQLTVATSEYRDNGSGLRLINGSPRLAESSSVSAADRRLQLNLTSTGSVSARWVPAVAIDLTSFTDNTEITAGNRQLTYTMLLNPKPEPGSVVVEFLLYGRWYVLRDDGAGQLTGEASGNVNYNTGSMSVTLPAEPDIGGRIVWSWSASVYQPLPAATLEPLMRIALPAAPIPGTLSVNWGSGSASDAGDGSLTGAGGGLQGSSLLLKPGVIPSGNVVVSFDQKIDIDPATTEEQEPVRQTRRVDIVEQSGVLTFDLGVTDFYTESLTFTLKGFKTVATYAAGANFFDGPTGTSRVTVTAVLEGTAGGELRLPGSGKEIGTANPSTGIVSIELAQANLSGVVAQELSVSYLIDSSFSAPTSKPVTVTVKPQDQAWYTPVGADPLMPGAQVFQVGNQLVWDLGDGFLYKNWNAQTGAGVSCGTLDYMGSAIELDSSSFAGSMEPKLLTGLAGYGLAVTQAVVFRTSASPLRHSGLQFYARRASDGALLIASSDNAGIVGGSFDENNSSVVVPQEGTDFDLELLPEEGVPAGGVTGSVDAATGVVQLAFDQPVLLSSLAYNAVAYATVPLDPEVIGLNPVRLPTSGEVPIFQAGYVTVVHNTQSIPEPAPTAGKVIDCGRTGLQWALVRDASGVDLAPEQYSVDKAAGVVTLADPFNAIDAQGNSLTLPLKIEHRVQDVVALGAVGIDGTLQLITELRNDYSSGDSYVSGCIGLGDMQARVTRVFDDRFDNGWQDEPSDSEGAAASYDLVNYPILIDNRSAIEERWKLKFTSSSGFEVIGERLGVIASGSINADCSPINPNTNEPYFTIKADGWGSGWVSSNVLRFNTVAAAAPVWAIRTTLPKSTDLTDDQVLVEFWGDSD